MSRHVDHTERVSESFNALDHAAQPQMLAELFTRLTPAQADTALALINFWRVHDGHLPPMEQATRRGRPRKAAEPPAVTEGRS